MLEGILAGSKLYHTEIYREQPATWKHCYYLGQSRGSNNALFLV